MSSRFIMSDVVSWFSIAFCDCNSFCFMRYFARLLSMEVSSEVRSNDTISSLFSSLAMRSLSKNSFDNFMVVVETATAREERFVDIHLAIPYRGELCRSTIGCTGICCL